MNTSAKRPGGQILGGGGTLYTTTPLSQENLSPGNYMTVFPQEIMPLTINVATVYPKEILSSGNTCTVARHGSVPIRRTLSDYC